MEKNNSPTMQQLSEFLYAYRIRRKISLVDLSLLIFGTKSESSWLHKIECGKLKSITTDRLDKILKGMNYETEFKQKD